MDEHHGRVLFLSWKQLCEWDNWKVNKATTTKSEIKLFYMLIQGRIQVFFDSVQSQWAPKKTAQIFPQVQLINSCIFR